MTPDRFAQITSKYPTLRIAVVGDFCLDRYLEIDAARREVSLETNLEVFNVTQVRAQPGAAGTVLNNLVALGIGTLLPVGFCGEDGEGYELRRELGRLPGVCLDHFITTSQRRTFTYCKPLVLEQGAPPRELNRLDSKNWTPTPTDVEAALCQGVGRAADQVDAIIVMDQVDVAQTGVITQAVLKELGELARRRPELLILADSRRGLQGYPPVTLKMNRSELGKMLSCPPPEEIEQVESAAIKLARLQKQRVVVTLAERGLVGADPQGKSAHLPCLPVRGPIDIVGAGDSVSANLSAALAAGASLRESLELANAAASCVIHQLGTTGTASVSQLSQLLG